MQGYWLEDNDDPESILKNGWLHTGDVAVMDSDGYFQIISRKRDTIFNGEYSIYPRDIEEVLYENNKGVCDGLGSWYEIIFVDDGSRDRTFSILENVHIQDGRVNVVRFRKNYGQTAAMTAGFRAAWGKIVVSMDGDLQNDPADIPRLLSKLDEGYDLVCGWRKERKDNFISRRIPSVIANWLIGKLTGGLATMAKQRKVRVLQATAKFESPNRVRLDNDETVEFEKCIIAAGSEPMMLPGLPDDPRIVDSTGALELAPLPKRLLRLQLAQIPLT